MKKFNVLILSCFVVFICACVEPSRVDTVFVISANAEWKAFIKYFPASNIKQSPYGEYFFASVKKGGAPALFFYGGWGKISAAGSTQYVIDRWHPKLIVNLATCGGFSGEVHKGDIINVTRTITYDIIEAMGNPDESIQFYAADTDFSLLPKVLQPKVRNHLIVSADRDIVPAEMQQLKKKYNAIVGDWESSSIAFVAKKNNTRVIILRGVSDIVSVQGGEAYGNVSNWVSGTDVVMKNFIPMLKEF